MANKVRIFLDAGHGGSDSGATLGIRKEKDDNLKIVLAVGKKLVSDYSNVVVGYARKTDIFESVTKKAKDSNEFNADYFFSFHRNAFNKKAKGYVNLYKTHSKVKDAIMEDVRAEMESLGFEIRTDMQRDDLGVLNGTDAPALLFEVGFIDVAEDNKIFDRKFDAIVKAFVHVIAKNCGLVAKKSGKEIKVGDYNAMLQTIKECPVRKGKGTAYKKLGTLAKGEKVEGLYVSKNKAGNLWISIDYGETVGYIYAKNVKAI